MIKLLVISFVSIAVATQAMESNKKKLMELSSTQKLNEELIRVCKNGGSVDEVKELLEQGAELSVICNGETLLHLAVRSQNYDLCAFLIEQGVNVMAKNRLGMVALHIVAYRKHKKLCELLLDNGTPVDVLAKGGMTPLAIVCRCCYRTTADQNGDICQLFLDRGTDPFCRDADDRTPLWYSVLYGYAGLSKTLLGASMIKPATQEVVVALRKNFVGALCMLKRLKFVKDMRNKILMSHPDLIKDRATILYYDLCNGHTLTSYELSLLMRTIPGYTFEMVKPLLIEELKGVEDDEIKELLDPDMLEENFGETITPNISKKLLLLQEKAMMNEINK